jgi:hypothetical protein
MSFERWGYKFDGAYQSQENRHHENISTLPRLFYWGDYPLIAKLVV